MLKNLSYKQVFELNKQSFSFCMFDELINHLHLKFVINNPDHIPHPENNPESLKELQNEFLAIDYVEFSWYDLVEFIRKWMNK